MRIASRIRSIGPSRFFSPARAFSCGGQKTRTTAEQDLLFRRRASGSDYLFIRDSRYLLQRVVCRVLIQGMSKSTRVAQVPIPEGCSDSGTTLFKFQIQGRLAFERTADHRFVWYGNHGG
jgi:hypothetical protein